ncbi:MAG: DegQ family serine endoprotease [Chlamydiia bacterium]|nr:DegQ family serine endoprotease [Chlamydiia bacterium]
MLSFFKNYYFLAFVLSISLFANETRQEELLKEISSGFASVAKKAIPAVVYIESSGIVKEDKVAALRRSQPGPYENPFDYFHDEFFNRFFGQPYQEQPQKKKETVRGSGFIFSNDGYIITNNHVVEGAEKVRVTLNGGKKVFAEVIGTDPKTDLAVIKINETGLSHLSFGNSDNLQVGDWAIAVGNPFGLDATVTVGIVSAKGRSQLNITDFEDFIQTDAAINPGNSGGPLLNIKSEVIGINTAIVSGSGGYMGIGFAIPSNMAWRIVEQLIKNGSVTRGFLGVTLQPIDSDLADFYQLQSPKGALVTDVVKGSPADLAGLKQEDVIVEYNGQVVENLSGFRNSVALMPPGSKLDLKVNREGKIRRIKVTISSMPDEAVVAGSSVQKLGIAVQTLTPELASQLGITDEGGVIVSGVMPESAAAQAGIRKGSVIVAVNRKRVNHVEEFNKAVHAAATEGRVLLMLRQGDAIRFVTLHFG